MLEGKVLNLRIMEKEDLPQFAAWLNTPEFTGEHNPLRQSPKIETERIFDSPLEMRPFFVEKKDGTKVGFIAHFNVLHIGGKQLEIGFSLAPSERGHGYGTEAVRLMVEYLFLSRENVRIQAQFDLRNIASQRILEKNGFKKEGKLRKVFFMRGEWRDAFIYSILRSEWERTKNIHKKGSR